MGTNKKESAKVTNKFSYKEGNIINFIHKTRQIMLHNRKDMFKRTQNEKRNIYTKYMEEVYKDEKCILCNEGIDDREHYKICKYNIEDYNKMLIKIKEMIINRSKKNIAVFGDIKENEEELSRNEIRINGYPREFGERFFIPIGVKEYLREMGFRKDWKKTRDDIMEIYIRGRMEIYQKRCKGHSEILKTKQLKRKWVNGKTIWISNDPLDRLPKKVKYNEIIDLTEDEPSIIIDLNAKKRKKESQRTPKEKTKRIKKVKEVIITGIIPSKGKKRKKD